MYASRLPSTDPGRHFAMSRTIVFATLGMTQMARGVCGAGMLLSIALSACSDLPKGSPSNGNGNGNGPGTCTLTASNFPTVGELGNVQWVTQAQTPGLLGPT